jgi:predicted DCC family thiol-disulfide oxidoreductase YuxK
VRFVARRDAAGRIRFAPLGGVTFQRQVPEVDRRDLPDSLVVLAPGSRPLTRSDAVAHLLRALGGAWAVGARLLAIVPRPLRDGAYDLVARFRARLFRRPEGVCPCLPPALLDRFDP